MIKKIIKPLYYFTLKIILLLVGLDFRWYKTFYVQWPHAIPIVEPIIQILRPRKKSIKLFRDFDITKHLQKGDIVLDIGANIGLVSSHFLKLGYDVHAYEPDSRCIEFLKRRFSMCDSSRFHLHHGAVYGHDGTIRLNYGEITTESNTIITDRPGAQNMGGEEVRVFSIQSILDKFNYVPLIKMDIEGAEYNVLADMLKSENVDKFGWCLVEAHAKKIPKLKTHHEEIVKKIDELGLQKRVLLTNIHTHQ